MISWSAVGLVAAAGLFMLLMTGARFWMKRVLPLDVRLERLIGGNPVYFTLGPALAFLAIAAIAGATLIPGIRVFR